MLNRNLYLVNLTSLFDILNEISDLINFNIFEINKKDIRMIHNNKNINFNNSIFIINQFDILKNSKIFNKKNCLIVNEEPIQIVNLIEKLNILFLKKIFKENSQIKLNNYILNINDRLIMSDQVSIKLTEKELNILLFLNSKRNQPQNVEILQSKIWGYGENLETHTVETHIYRLRKKISNKFSDYSFIKSNKYGYFL